MEVLRPEQHEIKRLKRQMSHIGKGAYIHKAEHLDERELICSMVG